MTETYFLFRNMYLFILKKILFWLLFRIEYTIYTEKSESGFILKKKKKKKAAQGVLSN